MDPESTRKEYTLRFYGHITMRGTWKVVCVDLDLAVERPSLDDAIQAINQQTVGYLRTVCETNDQASLAYLLPRPAPLRDRLMYKLICVICWPQNIAKWLRCLCLVKRFSLPECTYA